MSIQLTISSSVLIPVEIIRYLNFCLAYSHNAKSVINADGILEILQYFAIKSTLSLSQTLAKNPIPMSSAYLTNSLISFSLNSILCLYSK